MFESNKDLIKRSLEQIWNQGDFALIDRVFAPGYVFRHPNFPEPLTGPEGYRRFVRSYRTAFPDLHLTINELIAEGDTVVCRWTVTGTHSYELRTTSIAAPPSHHQVIWTGVNISTVRDGTIVDDLMYSDTLGLRMQLGFFVLEPHEMPSQA